MARDMIGDFLTIIRNGIMASLPSVDAPHSKMRLMIANILKNEGFVRDVVEHGEGANKVIRVHLKYVDGESAIHEIKRVSRPGGRVYTRIHDVRPVIGGLGLTILTTSRGVLTNKQAKQAVVGGEVLCTVW